jgi:predicted amidophosphoribosyltransferase
MKNNIDKVSDFNCRFPGATGPEPTHCEHCGNVLVPDRETVNHCDRLCFEAWQKEQEAISEIDSAQFLVVQKVFSLLTAKSALEDLFHAYNDSRGVELARHFEDEAHALWRDSGFNDMCTSYLITHCQNIRKAFYE